MPNTRAGAQQVAPGNPNNILGLASVSGLTPELTDPTVNGSTETTLNPPAGIQTPVRSSSLSVRTTETITDSVTKPGPQCPTLDKITGSMQDVAKEALQSIAKRKRAEAMVNLRLRRLAENISQIKADMEKSTDIPTDAVVTNLILRTSKDTLLHILRSCTNMS